MSTKAPNTVSVTATPQRVTGFNLYNTFSLRNTGANSVYYIQDDSVLTTAFAGTHAVLKALGASEIKAGEVVIVGPDIAALDVVCATGLTSTFQTECGNLTVQGVAPLVSTVYNGGGTSNALRESIATSALPTSAVTIAVGSAKTMKISVYNDTAAQTETLTIVEYSAATPTIATSTHPTSAALGSDIGRTFDRTCLGFGTITEFYVKQPVIVDVTPGSYVQLSIIENITGSAYAIYTLRF